MATELESIPHAKCLMVLSGSCSLTVSEKPLPISSCHRFQTLNNRVENIFPNMLVQVVGLFFEVGDVMRAEVFYIL